MSIHLPQLESAPECPPAAPKRVVPTSRKVVRLSDLGRGETARILRVDVADAGCRKRFAELGLAEGMKVTVSTTGDTLMLILGTAKMGLACRCADEITVMRL